jgi:transposase InsO family protein
MSVHTLDRPAAATTTGLSPGMQVRWNGDAYTVSALQGATVHLTAGDPGVDDVRALVSAVVDAPGFAVLDRQGRDRPGTQVPDISALGLLTDGQRRHVRDWERHLIELIEGHLPDADPDAPPRPGYDPQAFTQRQRDATKAAELQALGWKPASAATVTRRRLAYADRGIAGLIREVHGSPWGRTDERVVTALLDEVAASTDESSTDAVQLLARLEHTLRARYHDDAEELTPSRATFYRLLERLGITPASLKASVRRRVDTANIPSGPFTPSVAQGLGEQVQIDSTGLDILAVGDDGRIVQLELIAAIDVATRTIIGAMIVPKVPGQGPRGRRLGGRAARSFDAVLLLAQALAPMPGRPGWSPRAMAGNSEMPYADLVACDPRMIGAAARPVIRPKLVVVDHGKIFNSEHFVDACRTLKIAVRGARVRTPTDKAIIESTFGAIKKLFCQYVAGYTGRDLEKRGKRILDGPLWSINELQDLLDEWIALRWQQTPHDGLRNPLLPGVKISPNRMYATLVAAEGHVPMPLTVEENRKLLPFKRLKVTRKGVRIDNRTYNSPGLQKYLGKHSGLRGQGMKWQVRYSPYAPRYVWLWDHQIEGWVEAEFVHQRLIGEDWSLYLWEQATAAVVAAGGYANQEREIAREVSLLRARARSGPDPADAGKPRPLFTGPRLALRTRPPNPYQGIPTPDPATVVRAASLNIAADGLLPSQHTPRSSEPARSTSPQPAAPETSPAPPAHEPAPTSLQSASPPEPATASAPTPRRDHDRRSLTGSAADLFALPPTRRADPHTRDSEIDEPGEPS